MLLHLSLFWSPMSVCVSEIPPHTTKLGKSLDLAIAVYSFRLYTVVVLYMNLPPILQMKGRKDVPQKSCWICQPPAVKRTQL